MTKVCPRHVAVIMDGNSRWAKKNNLSKEEGYTEGIKKLQSLITSCIKFKIKFLTVFALSTENKNRKDINILYSLIRKSSNNTKINNFFKDIEFRLIGDRTNISKDILIYFERLENRKINKKKITFNLAYNYGSWNELEICIKRILNDINKNNISYSDINENLIKRNLFTKELPDPDLLIRTGGQKRLSNFLLLQLKYTELFFISELWPDFEESLFINILDEYSLKNRTFGL